MTVLAYRPAEDADRAFVIDSWLASYRTAHAAGLIQFSDWTRVMAPQLERVLARHGCVVIVAYRPDEADTMADLYGWIAAEDARLVHYVYVKKPYRLLGIARGLLRAAGAGDGRFSYTCKTGVISKIDLPYARWTPLAARAPKNNP